MKLYLSSFHLGSSPEKLQKLVGPNKKAAIINNALDYSTELDRLAKSKQSEIDDLKSLGFDPEELDLRNFFGKPNELKEKIKTYGVLWVRGGNTFVLRRAMKESGLDEIIVENMHTDNFVYAGYSAGICVLSPTLKGIEIVDDPIILPPGYKNQTIWEGLNILDYYFAPHYRSDHPESEGTEKTVQYYIDNKLKFIALHDGEAIVEEIK